MAGRFVVWDGATVEGRAAWIETWRAWPEREVFAHPAYVSLWADGPSRRPMAAYGEFAGVEVLHPFVWRDLTLEPFWDEQVGAVADLTSAYGYGGPFAWGAGQREEAATSFWVLFDEWARDHGVASEFIRRLPLTDATLPGYSSASFAVVSQNVVRTLAGSVEEIWGEYEHKVRKNVAKAQRSGVVVTEDASPGALDTFLPLYTDTMSRRGAARRYSFGRAFFERLQRDLAGQFLHFHAWHEGRAVSTELVLVSARHTYSFLGGTDSVAFDVRPNDLLKHRIIGWSKARGCSRFVLGGGYGPDDGIFRYKRSFAPGGVVDFVVGRRILLHGPYEAMAKRASELRARAGDHIASAPSFFPAYRDV